MVVGKGGTAREEHDALEELLTEAEAEGDDVRASDLRTKTGSSRFRTVTLPGKALGGEQGPCHHAPPDPTAAQPCRRPRRTLHQLSQLSHHPCAPL